jgi:hypothetical protein
MVWMRPKSLRWGGVNWAGLLSFDDGERPLL